MSNEVIVVSDLTKNYGQLKAVDKLNLKINAGEIFGLLGPNGAGKTTTIECILGTKKRNDGNVEILNMDPVSDRKRLFEKVGVQFQDSFYPDRIKVKEICELVASLYSKTIDWKSMLIKFSLEDKINQQVSSLSGGERQKLSVILALLHEPKIVFLDELTTGLDPLARREVWSFLKSLKEREITIFLTSHYMDEVNFLCDRITIIDKGKEILTGTPEQVIKESGKDNLEEAYLSFIDNKEDKNEEIMGII